MKLARMISVILMIFGLTNINAVGANESPVKWKSIGPGVSGACYAIAYSPHNPQKMIFGTDMGAIFLTEDGGQTWQTPGAEKDGDNPGYRGAWNALFDPKNPNIAWVAGEHGVYKSMDEGKNWRRMTAALGATNLSFQGVAIDPSDSNVVYTFQGWSPMGTKKWVEGQIWRTTDGGLSWQWLTPPAGKKQGTLFTDMLIDPNSEKKAEGHQRLFICGRSGFFKSEDGGQTWESLASKLPLPDSIKPRFGNLWLIPGKSVSSIMVTVNPNLAADGKTVYGGIFRSDDSGNTWKSCNINFEKNDLDKVVSHNNKNDAYNFAIYLRGSTADQNRLYAGLHPAGIFRSNDQGKTWYNTTQKNRVWIKMKLSDGSETYLPSNVKKGNFVNSYAYDIDGLHGLAVSNTNPDLVSYTDMGGLISTANGGKTWSDVIFDYGKTYDSGRFNAQLPTKYTNTIRSRGPQIIVGTDIVIDPFDKNIIYASYMDHGFRVSRDGGEWWENPSRGLETYHDVNGARSVTCDPQVKGKVYFTSCYPNGRAFVSEDFGRSFKNISLPNPDKVIVKNKNRHSGIVIDPSSPQGKRTLYMTTDKGLFKSFDGGINWKNITPVIMKGADSIKVLKLDPTNSAILYVGTDPYQKTENAGLFKSTDAGEHWEKIMSDKIGGVWSVAICRSKPNVIYVVANKPGEYSNWVNTTIWKSSDSGKKWQSLRSGLYHTCAVNPLDPDWIYTAHKEFDINKAKPEYLRSRDGGKTWESIGRNVPIVGALENIIIDDNDPHKIFFLDWFTIYSGNDTDAPTK